MTLIDTNVLLDVFTNDSQWVDWSVAELDAASIRGVIAINDVIYAELAPGYTRIEILDAVLKEIGVSIVPIPRPALFLAGKTFQRYRAAGAVRTGVLSDFFIGAHAVVAGMRLLTRDTRRYRTYFPDIDLITSPARA